MPACVLPLIPTECTPTGFPARIAGLQLPRFRRGRGRRFPRNRKLPHNPSHFILLSRPFLFTAFRACCEWYFTYMLDTGIGFTIKIKCTTCLTCGDRRIRSNNYSALEGFPCQRSRRIRPPQGQKFPAKGNVPLNKPSPDTDSIVCLKPSAPS